MQAECRYSHTVGAAGSVSQLSFMRCWITALVTCLCLLLSSSAQSGLYKPHLVDSDALPTGVTIYSGFIPLNRPDSSTHRASIYYLLSLATETSFDDAPLALWLQGGPGATGFIFIFKEGGPLRAIKDADGSIHLAANKHTWNKKLHMLFIGEIRPFNDPKERSQRFR